MDKQSLYIIAGCNGAGKTTASMTVLPEVLNSILKNKRIMSEQEEINLFNQIKEGISKARRKMLERKAKLGETVIIADTNGMPIEINAKEVLNLSGAIQERLHN